MKNKILFGAIGVLLASVASVGVAVAQEHFANPSAELSIQSVFGLQGEDSSGDSKNEAKSDDSQSEVSVSHQTQTNASVSSGERRGDDDGDFEDEGGEGFEDEGDDDSGGVRTQTSVASSQQGTQTAPPATAKTFTMAEVGKHNNQSSCYTAISGSVYDVTAWISQHPGGASAILSLCGIDGTAAFTGQHGGQGRPASELASFKIGALVK